jgi:RNA-directed DNA polymerase
MGSPLPCPESECGLRSQGYSWAPTASRVYLVNQGTSTERRRSESGKPPSQARSLKRGGASVVVRARESRVHGEGGQSTSRASKPQGKAMYVVSQSDKDWLLSEQRKLYARSWDNPDYVFHKLWGLVTDLRNLRIAFGRIASNRGRRSAGVDGQTVASILATQGADVVLEQIRGQLRSRAFRPQPVRRVLIPKPGQPGKFRPLGIATVTDRVVQAALKNILEPIFEADFFPSSFGFRPGKSAHAALEQLRKLLMPRKPRAKSVVEDTVRFPYQWAIEGDIKGCFDNIGHHALMERIRSRVVDAKVNALVVAFLKAGVMDQKHFFRPPAGSPQGSPLSPLLANIALAVIDERYETSTWPRRSPFLLHEPRKIQLRAIHHRNQQRKRRKPTTLMVPVRYADDFLVLVGASRGSRQNQRAHEAALAEKVALASILKDSLGLELSEHKTAVTPVTSPMRFLGHHVRVQRHPKWGWVSKTVVPKDKSKQFRHAIKQLVRAVPAQATLQTLLRKLNPMLRGWSAYYRHAWGAKRVFSCLDAYVWASIARWLKKKHRGVSMKHLVARHSWRLPGRRSRRWRDGNAMLFTMVSRRVQRYRHGWMKPPDFASTLMESPVHIERCTPGSGKGLRKPARG